MLSRVNIRAWWAGWVLAGLVVLAGLLLVSASPLGINRTVPFAALLGPRNALTMLTCLGFVAAAVSMLWQRPRSVATPFALGLLVLTVTSGTVVVGRGFANAEPAPPAPGQLRILSWNTNDGLVDPPVIATLAARLHADVVVLPDTDPGAADYFATAFEDVGLSMRLHADPGPSGQIAVYTAASYDSLYDHVVPGPDPGKTLRITSGTPDLPDIIALHAAQPTFHGTAQWNTDLNWVADQCRSGEAVAVGDFNATVDGFGSAGLGGCLDAATARHAASVGTWPTALPTWLGMPIDHVLTTPGWHARTFTVITDQDDSGALHRPIFTVITR